MKNRLSLALLSLTALQFPIHATQTTFSDQTDVSVTAYNSNIALVRDRRKLDLPQGEFELTFMDVAEQIRPETISLKSISEPGSVAILEQNYEFDLMSPEKMLEKYVGKTVELMNFQNDVGFSSKEAELLSTNGGPIYRIDGKIYLTHPGHVVLPKVPGDLIAKPSLIWLLDNASKNQTQEIEASYLTGGISWKADYVVTLAKTEDLLNIDGWVTLTNHSGTTFTNAQLKLVAGDIHTAAPKYGGHHMYMARASMMNDSAEMKFCDIVVIL